MVSARLYTVSNGVVKDDGIHVYQSIEQIMEYNAGKYGYKVGSDHFQFRKILPEEWEIIDEH